jgi:hypothetical protein
MEAEYHSKTLYDYAIPHAYTWTCRSKPGTVPFHTEYRDGELNRGGRLTW